jgi:acetyl-CoA carboxylase biotin carboxyl carrier protein
MTELMTPGPGTEPSMLLAQVRESMLHLVAELPNPPARIRISVQDVAVEMDWTAVSQRGDTAAVRNAGVIGVAETPAAGTADQPAPGGHAVTAAIVGTFYRAPEPGAPPFVTVGDAVRTGQQLGIVEAMKLMIPVEADVDGLVREVLKGDGQPVEFGEPLFVIEQG